ncbi:MAG: hypothetical protein K2Y22_14885 [Candidatus Obscuribacterales bacterium]|nr:hypothetical protein [Candidatus Obscuribacterales bacterium]
MENSKRSQSLLPILFIMAIGSLIISGIVMAITGSEGYYLRAAMGSLDPNVRELSRMIPQTKEYNRASSLRLQEVPTGDPIVRQQARELAKDWIRTFYTRMNNYTHDFCFVLVDKEKYSINAVTLAIRAFQANGYKVKLSDSGFYYIVEIAE